MKRLMTILLLAAMPAAAHAEMFTFKSTPKPIGQVQLPAAGPGGRPSGAQVYGISTETVYADGKKLVSAGQCASWILPAGNQFGSNGACKYSDASGETYIVQFTCEVPGPASDCWGKIVGTGGPFKGRTGAFTFHNAPGSTGTGFWTD